MLNGNDFLGVPQMFDLGRVLVDQQPPLSLCSVFSLIELISEPP
jgi:hypothetical protein